MKLDPSVRRIVIAPENEQDAAYLRMLFHGQAPRVSVQNGALVLEGPPEPPGRYEMTPGDLALRSRLDERIG